MLDIKVAATLFARVKVPPANSDNPGSVNGFIFLGAAVVNAVFIVSGLVYLIYTLGSVIPVLTIVESKHEYETLPMRERQGPGAATEPSHDADARPVTDSICNVHRLLWSVGRFASLFQASSSFCLLITAQATLAAILKAVPLVPDLASDVVITILTLQLQMAWVHSAMIRQNKKASPIQLPGFRMAFHTTAIPALFACFAASMAESVAILAVVLLHGEMAKIPLFPQYPTGLTVETFAPEVEAWKIGVYIVIRYAFLAVFYIPAQAALVRVQASLLPVEKETIVKVDRTFGVEGVHETGYLTMTQAYKSMKNGSIWLRLYKMYAKVFLVGAGVEGFLYAILLLEFFAFLYLR
ncbi:hypothetical protein PFICI_10067 [Pestalotiopsis fici W106-1]|uniref:Uncharacterized protein n=1 Tax=Pestalotiopsis fici (strain W106-1 / CGMCC3.15140) TaxID=1229662 RepID=W3WVW8_PESFW|nr:uncharacterized protein PFICI_10067 [Pestalotiopsis fici W106-1]ETS78005.1 hypothetical protein PFICI_10067 [Pestalotiopsis fici W106-1]